MIFLDRKKHVNSTAVSRARLASLWFSQVFRNVADNALRVFVLLRVAEASQAQRGSAWHLLAALLMLPAVLLAPFNGAISNTFSKRWVLTSSAIYCLVIVSVFGLCGGPWIAGWALLAVGAALYSPTRYAMLPAAAVDALMPLTRVNGLIEMGAVTAIVAGLALGISVENTFWLGLPAAVAAAIALNLLAAVSALPTAFPSAVRRPEQAMQAIAGFFHDTARIWRDREAKSALLALACLRGIVAGATGAFIAVMLSDDSDDAQTWIEASFPILAWILGGAALGSVLAGLQRHPVRALGLVPFGAAGLAIGLVLAATGNPGPIVSLVLGLMGGLINVPLAAAYQTLLPADARGNGMAVRNFFDYLVMAAISALLVGLSRAEVLSAGGQMWLMASIAAAAALVAWFFLYREAIEQMMEIAIVPIYRIKGHGPGLYNIPLRGPLLVVANHACWFDPVFVAKVVPRSLRAMMLSTFYDLPFLKWVMVYIARAIRVQYSTFRRDAPELQEAIRALDAGEAVLIFPEGSLRKSAERPLRRFGQGVWHILNERPQTPVVVCWIEGNWGSFFSYFNGKPTKNKRFDAWRRIDIAVGEPQLMDRAKLTDQRATRGYLEQCCRQMRGVLGLEVPRADNEPEE